MKYTSRPQEWRFKELPSSCLRVGLELRTVYLLLQDSTGLSTIHFQSAQCVLWYRRWSLLKVVNHPPPSLRSTLLTFSLFFQSERDLEMLGCWLWTWRLGPGAGAHGWPLEAIRQGQGFSSGAFQGNAAPRPILHFCLENCKITNLHYFNRCVCGNWLQLPIGN